MNGLNQIKRKRCKGKSPKRSHAINVARTTMVNARQLLGYAHHCLGDLEDCENLRKMIAECDDMLKHACTRLEIESSFLRWRETKILKGEWNGDQNPDAPVPDEIKARTKEAGEGG